MQMTSHKSGSQSLPPPAPCSLLLLSHELEVDGMGSHHPASPDSDAGWDCGGDDGPPNPCSGCQVPGYRTVIGRQEEGEGGVVQQPGGGKSLAVSCRCRPLVLQQHTTPCNHDEIQPIPSARRREIGNIGLKCLAASGFGPSPRVHAQRQAPGRIDLQNEVLV